MRSKNSLRIQVTDPQHKNKDDQNAQQSNSSGSVDELDGELNSFWNRRDELNETEWTRFYRLVSRVLAAARPRQLTGLPSEEIGDLIHGFFVTKVFQSTSRRPQDVSAKFVQVAFRNYLTDVLRDQTRREALARAAQPQETEEARPAPCEDVSLLSESGLDPKMVATSAREFLAKSEEWVQTFLGLHYCPDGTDSEPLYTLARRLHVAAYQYRARQLGITRKKAQIGNYTGYEGTLLGQWLGSLKVEICPENSNLILVVFKILCREALTVQEINVS